MNDTDHSKKKKPAPQEAPPPHRHRARYGMLGLGILALSFAASWAMVKFTARPERRPPPRLVPMVEVQALAPSSEQIRVSALGTVVPARQVQLFAQVQGEIVAIHDEFVEGGFIAAGETVVAIDPRDYDLAVRQMEARVEMARNNLRIEEGQQAIARREWDLMGTGAEASELELDLATRQPQLRNLKALFAAAEADLAGAQLALERTQLRAPFDAVVVRADAQVGDLARMQSVLGVLCATDKAWVRATVGMDRLRWIDFPGPGREQGSEVTVIGTLGAPRQGRVVRLMSDLEPAGRMARLLVEVEDPFRRASPDADPGALLLGEFVRLEIQGRRIDNVYRIPRDALREGSEIWLADGEDRLRIRPVQPEWTTPEIALIQDNLQPGDRLVISPLSTPVEGMSLRIAGSDGAPERAQDRRP